ncbi:MAG: Hydantoinase/oxoprolinase N-terminal region [Planctomycetota bacterium]
MTVASSIANESNTLFAWEVGVDTGGTFTDCIARSRDGETVRAKVLSTSAVRGRLLSIRSLILTLEIHLPLADQTIDAFFRGFAVRLAGAANTSDSSNATIQECNRSRS